MPADIPSLRIQLTDDSPQQPSAGGSSKDQSASESAGPAGTRTPRHVQFHSAAVHYDEKRARKRSELDETATDPQAFSALSVALQEYSSDSGLQRSLMTNRLGPPSQAQDDHNHLLSGEGFIDPDERAGLPSVSADAGAQSQVNIAASLVTAHTKRRKILPSLPALRLPGLSSKKASTKTEREKILEHPSYGHDGTLDVESNPATIGRANNTLAGGGILSALLSLYDANDGDRSDTSSLNSGLSTPLIRPKGKDVEPHSAPASPNANPSHDPTRLSPNPESRKKQSRAGRLSALAAAGGAATAVGGGEGADYFTLTPATTPGGAVSTKPHYKNRWSGMLKDLPTPSFFTKEGTSTPATDTDVESEGGRLILDKRQAEARRRRAKRRKAEVFITRHISDVLARQTFICKLARCMMMHGGPTHRLQAQIVSTGRVLEVPLSCLYLPDVMLISFDDQATYTSSLQLIKQGSALDLAKLKRAYSTYWAVIHDQISVKDAAPQLDELMRSRSTYPTPALIVFGGGASAMICVTAFSGSFLDGVCCFGLGMFLVFVQILTSRHELYSNMFEITMCTFISFVASALSQTEKLCYTAIASGSVVLILPGYIVLCGALELSSRNIVAGSVRLCYALIYALFLGFGLTIGLQIFQKMTDSALLSDPSYVTDYSCARSHDQDVWYRATPVKWWYFLTVPGFAMFLSLRNHAPWRKRELPLLVGIACVGWCSNYFSAKSFPNQTDVSAAIGGFAVGLVSNLYGRLFRGNAFVVMITGILFQLPSGLSNGGLFTSASQATIGNSSFYVSGFQTALQLVSTCIGLTVGLGISLVVVFPVQSRKRQAGVFSL